MERKKLPSLKIAISKYNTHEHFSKHCIVFKFFFNFPVTVDDFGSHGRTRCDSDATTDRLWVRWRATWTCWGWLQERPRTRIQSLAWWRAWLWNCTGWFSETVDKNWKIFFLILLGFYFKFNYEINLYSLTVLVFVLLNRACGLFYHT